MASKKTTIVDRIACIVLYAVSFLIYSIFALQLNLPNVVDEPTNIGGAILYLGGDWSEAITVMGNYHYRYGLNIIYYPILRLISNPYFSYKAMLTLNNILLAFIPVFAYKLVHKYLELEDRIKCCLISALVGMLPAGILFGQYIRADFMLIFLPWPILMILLRLDSILNPPDFEKNQIKADLYSLLIPVLATMAFAVHTRGIVHIIAVWLTVILVRLCSGRKIIRLVPAALMQIIVFAADHFAQKYYDMLVYGGNTAHASAEAFEFDRLKLIFTADGITAFLKLVSGWLFTITVSTFGIVLIGFCGALVIVVRYIRKWRFGRRLTDNRLLIMSFLGALLFAGSYGLGCLFFYPSVYDFLNGTLNGRADRLIYERYMEPGVGLVVILGLYLLLSGKRSVKLLAKLSSAAAFIGISVLFFSKIIPEIEGKYTSIKHSTNLCTFFNVPTTGANYSADFNLKEGLFYAAVLAFAVFILLLIAGSISSRRENITYGLLVICLMAFIAVIAVNSVKFRIGRDKALMGWISPACSLALEVERITDKYPVIIHDASAKNIEHYQFALRNYRMGGNETEAAKAENCLIIAKKKYFIREYYDNDYYTFDCFDYDNNRDIIYVKGKALKKRLESMGYSLTKYKGKLKNLPEPEAE